MLTSFLSAFLFMTSATASKWPDPYLGFSARTFGARYASETDATTGDQLYVERHQKFFTLGLPFQLKDLSDKSYSGLKLIGLPEFVFNDTSFMFNGCIGIVQDVDFGNYRAWPPGWFWETDLGIHYGYLTETKDYHRSETGVNPAPLRLLDRTSIAAILKLAMGPRFMITDTVHLKLRFGMDWAFGRLGLFMMRTRVSENIGSTWGIAAQVDFQ